MFRFPWRCDRSDIGRNVYMERMTCLLLMNKDLFSLLGWNNIFDVNTNSDHVPQREINGRDIYFPQECPDLRPILRDIPINVLVVSIFPVDLVFWTLMDRRVVRFFSWLSESFLPIPSLPELQRLPTSQLIKHFLCLPLSHSPRPDPVLAIPVSPAKT